MGSSIVYRGERAEDIEARRDARRKRGILFQTGWNPRLSSRTFGRGHGETSEFHEALWDAVKKVPDDMYAGFG